MYEKCKKMISSTPGIPNLFICRSICVSIIYLPQNDDLRLTTYNLRLTTYDLQLTTYDL